MYEIERDKFRDIFLEVFKNIEISKLYDFIEKGYFRENLICCYVGGQVHLITEYNGETVDITWYKITQAGRCLEILTPNNSVYTEDELILVVKHVLIELYLTMTEKFYL